MEEGVKGAQEPGQRQDHRRVWSWCCLWNFNQNKGWQGNRTCAYTQAPWPSVLWGSLWPSTRIPPTPAPRTRG